LPCLALPCLALPCLALPCLALPCLALPCLVSCLMICPVFFQCSHWEPMQTARYYQPSLALALALALAGRRKLRFVGRVEGILQDVSAHLGQTQNEKVPILVIGILEGSFVSLHRYPFALNQIASP
jgi:hypothetical protein